MQDLIIQELKQILRNNLVVVFVFLLCAFGAYLSYQNSASYQMSTYLSVVGKTLINGHIFKTSEDVLSAVEAGLRTKDKYLRFFYTDDEFYALWSSLDSRISKKFGILFSNDGTVTSVLKHSPNGSKILPGDKFVRVGSVTDPKLFLSTFDESSRSKKDITVVVSRNGSQVSVSLSPFILNPVYYALSDSGTLTITFYFFKTEMIEDLLKFLKRSDVQMNTKEIIFDFSQCPGGKVSTLNATLSFFFPEKSMLYYELRGTKRIEYYGSKTPIFNLTTFPGKITFLKSKRTASSAEIFIGVSKYQLQLAKNTQNLYISGETTYGKWTIIDFVRFLKGGLLRSIGSVYLPDGSTYEGVGF